MNDATKSYDREILISLCERGIVPVGKWSDRDSARSQQKLGKAWALLSAGCEYRMAEEPASDESTIWIEIVFPGFNAFEEGCEPENYDELLVYIPTDKRLCERAGRDWYS